MRPDAPSAETVFARAIEIESAEARRAFLEHACSDAPQLRGEVEQLVQDYFRAGQFLERPAAHLAAVAPPPPEGPGAWVGSYKLLQQIGEGGMGTVFMADQTSPVQRKVALKIVKPGMDSRLVIARFEAERQALALMDHPNIAKVLDAGTLEAPGAPSAAAGRPFFVMELVKGLPITKYCDEERLTPRERLEMFVPVCRAVQHAHQKGIIHRDLKPSNVLVAPYDGRPVPKVIDFGIAKATGQKLTERTLFTEFGQVIGTFEYMSPEQARLNQLDIDTRSDIYALGVLLYELLTGTTPLEVKRTREATFLEVLRLIREEEPPRPSTRLSTSETLPALAANRGLEPGELSGQLRGELDWIVMKALEKDRDRRYESAHGLARDIERYLRDEPVQACPPSALYRLRKLARRNKGTFFTAVGLTLALLVALAAVAGSIGWAARDRAERQAATDRLAEEALERATELIGQGRWPETTALVRRAEALLESGGGRPELRQRVRALLHDLQMVERLEEIRLSQSNVKDDHFDLAGADPAYAAAFRDYGLDVLALDPEVAADRIRATAIPE